MIASPGIYDIPAADYHADPVIEPSLSASVANVLLQKSPAHARMAHPRLCAEPTTEDSERFDLGSAAHALLLENDGSNILWVPHNDFRTNAAKELRDQARAGGKLPVLVKYQGVLQQMVKVANQAMKDSEFGGWPAGKPEQTVVWQEDAVWCRARPDWLTDDRKLIFNYKSSESAEPEFVIRQIGRLGYDVGAEFYLRGMSALGFQETKYVFLAQEIEPPFACSLVSLANSYREIAQDKVERAIQSWRMCLQSGQWPAYRLDIHYAEPPGWELAAFEARMAQENW